jgi:acylglycerol lipase
MSPVQKKTLVAKDGCKIASYTWRHPNARFVVLILHGHGEHMSLYESFVAQLQKLPCHVAGIDYRGHGLSDGIRGHAKNLTELVSDFKLGLEDALQAEGKLPFVLFGHSMGGGVLARYLCSEKVPAAIRGAILSAPLLSPKLSPIQKVQMVMAKALARIAPTLIVPANHDLSALSTEPEVEQMMRNDPLFHTQISMALGADFGVNGRFCLEHAHNANTPILTYWGSEDIFVKTELIDQFFQGLTGAKEKILFPGIRHAPHLAAPAAREEVFGHIRRFITQVCQLS